MKKNIVNKINVVAKKVAKASEAAAGNRRLEVAMINGFSFSAYAMCEDDENYVVVKIQRRADHTSYDEIRLTMLPDDAMELARMFCGFRTGPSDYLRKKIVPDSAAVEQSRMTKSGEEASFHQEVIMLSGVSRIDLFDGYNGNTMALMVHDTRKTPGIAQYVFTVGTSDTKAMNTLLRSVTEAVNKAKTRKEEK